MASYESTAEWLRTMLEERYCLDCEIPLDEGEGTLEFRGPPPHVECIGSLCLPCWAQREALRASRWSGKGEQ
jgi:hypothetical protein